MDILKTARKTKNKILIKRNILIFFISIILVFTVLKIYVLVFETNFKDYNLHNIEDIKNTIGNKSEYTFAVIGNVENSIDIFDKKILFALNEDDYDFVIFTGDSLLDGGEDKYGAFYKTLSKLDVPAIVGAGDNEASDFGTNRFNKHFGPYYFSFNLGDSYYIFMDTTGETSENWQKEWLQNEFQNTKEFRNKFVISNRPLEHMTPKYTTIFNEQKSLSSEYSTYLTHLFSDNNVTAVFTSNKKFMNASTIDEVNYFSSRAGGLFTLNEPEYNFYKVKVDKNNISYNLIKLNQVGDSKSARLWKGIWFSIHSWLYIGYINFILSLSIIFLIVYLTYSKLIEKPDLYPTYEKKIIKKNLTIAIFTNYYLPFIAGVPLSIERLKIGLEKLGHSVYIFTPKFGVTKDQHVINCKALFHYRKENMSFPIANIFSRKLKSDFKKINPDLVHVHHPYWLGYVGKKLAKKNNIPVVYTHHTRVEQYNHYVPLFKKLAAGRLIHMIIKRFVSSCNAIIVPTLSIKEYFRNLGVGKKIEVIPTGVDIEKYDVTDAKMLRQKYGEFILFSVFRLSKEKNPYFLLEGIKKIKELTDMKFRCLIAGSGPEEKNMKKFIKENGISDHVVLLGNVNPEKIPAYYNLCDLFIFSSKSETQGMVILEAMAGGSPVVAIQSSGTDEMIINKFNGFKTDDDIDEWCDKILFLMTNKEALERMGRNSKDFAAKYSLENTAKKVVKLYNQIL